MTHSEAGVIVVGAGQAGVQAAESLRAAGIAGPVTLVGDEPFSPYHRPPLSKAWLTGEIDAARLELRSAEALQRKGIALRSGVRVRAVDRGARSLLLDSGERLDWSALVLATGSRARRLSLPGADAPNVLTLRTRADADALALALHRCREQSLPVVVIGGGFIGLEAAASARKLGLEVTVVESAPRLLGRVFAPVMSDWVAGLHRAQGVTLELGAGVAGFEHGASGASVVLGSRGQRWPAGVVVVGIGARANDELAADAGLECDAGVVVDACGRTSDPGIVAAGDCTARRLADGTLLRLESVHNATEQGRCAAAALMGQERAFAGAPWFWSDQYGRKLQMAGLCAGADQRVLRGDMASAAGFSVWHFRGDRLLAVDSVDQPREHLLARKLLDGDRLPTPAQLGDPAFDPASLLAR